MTEDEIVTPDTRHALALSALSEELTDARDDVKYVVTGLGALLGVVITVFITILSKSDAVTTAIIVLVMAGLFAASARALVASLLEYFESFADRYTYR